MSLSAFNVYNRRSLLAGKSISPSTNIDTNPAIEDWNRTFGNGHSPTIKIDDTLTLNRPFEGYTQETLRDHFSLIATRMTNDDSEIKPLINFLALYLRQGGLLGQLLSSMNNAAQSEDFQLTGAEAPNSPRKNSSSTVLQARAGELIISETVEIHKIWRTSSASLVEESKENGKALASATLEIRIRLTNGELTIHNIGTRIKNRSPYAKKAFDERSILKILADALKFIGQKIQRAFTHSAPNIRADNKYWLFSAKLADLTPKPSPNLTPRPA